MWIFQPLNRMVLVEVSQWQNDRSDQVEKRSKNGLISIKTGSFTDCE